MSKTIEGVVGEGESQQELYAPPESRVLIEWFQYFDEVWEGGAAGKIGYGHDGDGRSDDTAADTMTNRQHPHWLRTKRDGGGGGGGERFLKSTSLTCTIRSYSYLIL